MELPLMAIGKTLTVYLAADVSKLRSGLAQADNSLSGFGNKLTSMVGPALIGAAAAAGAFAVALAVDGVQAAMAEEAELTKLSTTLENLGFSAASGEINTFIDDMQFATGVTDSELRPAFERLLISTGNVAQAQKLLSVALDTSAGGGKSLESVANALGKAYDGNFGALNKLNAGIDASIIKNKDLDGAVQQLSTTFGGQAVAQAETLQGQIEILGIAFDELKESLGKGLIDGFTSTGGGIGNLSQKMRELQPETEDLGKKLGALAGNLLDAALGAKAFADRGNELLQGILSFGGPAFELIGNAALDALNPIQGVIDKLAGVNKAINPSSGAAFLFGGAETGGTPTGAYDSINAMGNAISRFSTEVETAKTKVGTKSGTGLTNAIEKMNPALRAQIDLVKSLTTQLDAASKAVETARQEMYDWQNQMANQITSGIDLGAAFGAQFDAEGKSTGQSLIDGFNKQIEQAGLFGGYLQTLNTQGGPELRDAVAGLGPEIGNKLAKQIIDEGLVKTFQDKLVTVKSTARTAAEAMTPEFLVAGVQSAVNFLIGTQNALGAATSQLEEMGRAMGKTIGDAAAEEIRAALAAAGVAMSGGNATLGGTTGPAISAEAAARVAAGGGSFASALSSTSIAQAIERAIFDSNQRLGRTGQAVLQ
jgi:hypothetical protein